jgi:hypothetical protein
VSIYRSLAAKRPPIFPPDLACSLSYLFNILLALGRMHEVLLAIQEALSLLRTLAIQRPAVFSARLAALLPMPARCYSDVGYDEDSQQARKEDNNLDQWMRAVYGRHFNSGLAGYGYAFCVSPNSRDHHLRLCFSRLALRAFFRGYLEWPQWHGW